MADYKSMYLKLFNAITDTIHILQDAQAETEEMFLSRAEPKVTVLEQPDKNGLADISANESP